MPQDDQPLKLTLLARMMAVYTAAKVTLAIRTCEESGSRYHQRAWTCQEFVVARRLAVATQMAEPGDARTALSPDCDERMAVLRKRVQTQSFVPLWLRANSSTSDQGKVTEISRTDGESILKEFYSLSDHLNCQFPGDRLRALLPLVACAPLEDHQELVSLVLAISRATGDDLLDWKESLLKQHQKERKIIQKDSWVRRASADGGIDASLIDAQSKADSSDPSYHHDTWQEWHPKSAFKARVMGNVSQESVLKECNELRGMRRSVSVSGMYTTELSGLQYIKVPHQKRKRGPVKRDSTVSSFSGPCSRASTRSGPSSFQVTDGTDATMLSDNAVSLLQPQPAVNQGGCRRSRPVRQPSALSQASMALPEEPTPSTPHSQPPSTTTFVMPDEEECLAADKGASCPSPMRRRVTIISSIVSAVNMMSSGTLEDPTPDENRQLRLSKRITYSSALPEPWFPAADDDDGDDDGQTDEDDDVVSLLTNNPSNHRQTFFRTISSALSISSAVSPYKATPEMHQRPLSESRASGAAAMDSIGQLIRPASKASSETSDDNVFNLPGAAEVCPVTLSSPRTTGGSNFVDDSAEFELMSSSPDDTNSAGGQMLNPILQPTSHHCSTDDDDSHQSCKESPPGPSVLTPSDPLGAPSKGVRRSSLPSLRQPPVPDEYNPHLAVQQDEAQQLVSARVSLPTLHQPPSGLFGPSSAGGVWHVPNLLASFTSVKKTAAEVANESALAMFPKAEGSDDDCVIDMPPDGSR